MERKYKKSVRTDYEEELDQAYELGLTVHENYPFSSNIKGLIFDNDIYLSDRMNTDAQKKAVLGEEIEHFRRDFGNIVKQNGTKARKREKRTRKSTALKMVPVERLVEAAITLREDANTFSLAQELEVPEKLLVAAIDYYAMMYPEPLCYGNYLIRFNPFWIEEIEDEEE